MTKGVTTPFGHPLSNESKRRVNEVRLKITQPIHPNFNTDFNVYRFILAFERIYKKEKDIIDAATKLLNNHLRMRKAYKMVHSKYLNFFTVFSFQMDTEEVLSFNENPLFARRLMPQGDVLSVTDDSNRLLWYVEYASIDLEGLAHTVSSGFSIKCQFLEMEYCLRRVMEQEENTGRLSGIHHIVDLNGYEMNPWAMLFVSNGNLTYYSQLIHFENYPELVTPIEMVNTAKWIHVPYRLVRGMMPASFNDRIRLHDENFLDALQEHVKIENIPTSLGGTNQTIRCKVANKFTPDLFWSIKSDEVLEHLEVVQIAPRKTRQIYVDIEETGLQISWYFSTDGDVFFGVFHQFTEEGTKSKSLTHGLVAEKEVDYDKTEMVYPWIKIAARIVHETDSVKCERPGRYWLVFCNQKSWLQRRTVNIVLQITHPDGKKKRLYLDGTSIINPSIDVNEL
ncbi:hypothetical protein AB6A40_000861 [Gnathostoma spinigerum]|uniref:CRAL-TRIO domain-containing protein n=1 Tax=Gnathostoma spinigerum TaxID=75299 RepID=A0ABD6ECC9_9BILA